MKRTSPRIAFQWSVMLVGLALFGAWATSGRAESTMLGTVQDVPPGHIVISLSTELMTFEVTAQTSVTLDGRSADVSALRPGDAVRVTINSDADGSTVAMRIVAERNSAATLEPALN